MKGPKGSPHYDPPGRLTEPAGEGLKAFGITELIGARVNTTDPPVSKAQQHMMGAELRRKRAGMKTRTGMTEAELEEFAHGSTKGLPARKRKPR